jgi:DNA-3-methyladenine glycosylase I
MVETIRCSWASADPLSQRYHDSLWGVPCHDERWLFKMLILEGKQAGLAWVTILRKWDTLCVAFDDFDPRLLATYDEAKIASLLEDPGIIRNRLKVNAAVANARAYLKVCGEHGSLDAFLWAYVSSEPVIGDWETMGQIPVKTALSDTISRDLKQYGFKFVGSTIVYSYLQAVGVVNDHLRDCTFRFKTP